MSPATEIPFQSGEARDAEVEHEALDAYSRTVVGVAARLAPSVANLRITRRARGGHVPAGAGSGSSSRVAWSGTHTMVAVGDVVG